MKKKVKKLPKAIRPEEWGQLIKFIPNKDKISKIAFLLAYGSGMRISEVMRCKREHFRGDNSIFVPESKYGVERIVPRPKGFRAEFLNLLPLRKSIRTIQRRFEKYRDKAKLNPQYTFHSLRHGWAIRSLENGMPINQVQLGLGHSNIATTNIYTKASPQDLLKSYEDKF